MGRKGGSFIVWVERGHVMGGGGRCGGGMAKLWVGRKVRNYVWAERGPCVVGVN